MRTGNDNDRECGGATTPACGAAGTPPRGASPFEDDHYLVKRLIEIDNAAWDFVVGDRILPALAHSRKWSEILNRNGISPDEVVSEVFVSLADDNCGHLREFRFDCAFSSYLYNWMKAAMQTVMRKHGREIPKDLSGYEGELALNNQRQFSPGDIAAAHEMLEEFNAHLATAWEANPVQTMVLLLRETKGLSANEVAAILGVSSDNVHQMHKRAKTRLETLCGKGGRDVLG